MSRDAEETCRTLTVQHFRFPNAIEEVGGASRGVSEAKLNNPTRKVGGVWCLIISPPRRSDGAPDGLNARIWLINQRRGRPFDTRSLQLRAESDGSVASRRRHKSAAPPDLDDKLEGNESGEEAADSPLPPRVFVSEQTSKQEMKAAADLRRRGEPEENVLCCAQVSPLTLPRR